MFEDKVMRRIYGPREEEVIGGLGKLHNVGVHKSYSSCGKC
jgi:hypothetical protein